MSLRLSQSLLTDCPIELHYVFAEMYCNKCHNAVCALQDIFRPECACATAVTVSLVSQVAVNGVLIRPQSS